MKRKKSNVVLYAVVAVIVTAIVLKLLSNKNSMNEELKLISETNLAVPVSVDTVKYDRLTDEFCATGTFNAIKDVAVSSESQGKIVSIDAVEGDFVPSGKILASLDNKVLCSQLEQAKFNLEKAQKDLIRNENLYKIDGVTMQQFERAKQTVIDFKTNLVSIQEQYDNSVIVTPFDGIITKKYIDKGAFVSPGSQLFDMVQINKVKMVVKLSSSELQNVSNGQMVKISIDDFPGEQFEGTISAVIVKADLAKKFGVEITVDNKVKNRIKPGMYGKAWFQNNISDSTLVISRKAIVGSIKDPTVFVIKGNIVNSRKINAVPFNNNNVLVKSGLKSGEIIVTSGQINIMDNSKIYVQ